MPRKKMDISIKKAPVCYKLPPWIIRWLREQSMPAGRLIEEALKKHFKLKEPEAKEGVSNER